MSDGQITKQRASVTPIPPKYRIYKSSPLFEATDESIAAEVAAVMHAVVPLRNGADYSTHAGRAEGRLTVAVYEDGVDARAMVVEVWDRAPGHLLLVHGPKKAQRALVVRLEDKFDAKVYAPTVCPATLATLAEVLHDADPQSLRLRYAVPDSAPSLSDVTVSLTRAQVAAIRRPRAADVTHAAAQTSPLVLDIERAVYEAVNLSLAHFRLESASTSNASVSSTGKLTSPTHMLPLIIPLM